jgi:hypothetical protein
MWACVPAPIGSPHKRLALCAFPLASTSPRIMSLGQNNFPLVVAKMPETILGGDYDFFPEVAMARSKLFIAEEIITVRTALASERIPEGLKPPLRRYLKVLQKSRDGKREVLALLYPKRGQTISRGQTARHRR